MPAAVLVDDVVVTVCVETEEDVWVDELAAFELEVLPELPQPAIASAKRAHIDRAQVRISLFLDILSANPSLGPTPSDAELRFPKRTSSGHR